jgi:hypothetical protein
LKDFLGEGLYVFQESSFYWGKKRMNRIWEYGFEPGIEPSFLGELKAFQNRNRYIVETVQLRKPSLKDLNAARFLSFVESSISEDFISSDNLIEMQKLASCFSGSITSFFGFESHLTSPNARADYLFAVSSMRGERDALAKLVREKTLPKEFIDKPEWQNTCRFVLEWADPDSLLYQNVLGMWFEFDMVENSLETPVPCIFLHTIPLRITTEEDKEKISWLTKRALPLVTGKKIPEKIEQNLFQAIQRLPKDALVMDAGVMLSRPASGVRLIIAKIQPKQIIPYLTKLGWSEESEQLPMLLKDLAHQVSRVVLHITITENGVDQKIGLECSFAPDKYHLETRWRSFFNYLVKKGLCLPEKKDALLEFIGVDQDDTKRIFDTTSYRPIVKFENNDCSGALVRYISHIKLVYEPNQVLSAKAYPGVRLFGCPNTPSYNNI